MYVGSHTAIAVLGLGVTIVQSYHGKIGSSVGCSFYL